MSQNGTMLQLFEWYLPADGSHYRRIQAEAAELGKAGITAVWLPPAYKGAAGTADVGYAVYDLYDLGEFDQKGGIPTKYGTRQEYLEAIKSLQAQGIQVYADIVLNHHIGADGTEDVKVWEVNDKNRNEVTSQEETIRAWTLFQYPGRAGKYSDFTWNHNHFDGIDWDEQSRRNRIFQFAGKHWEGEVDAENGNYDYLMGADVDFDNPEVLKELYRWGKWYLDTTGVDGLRLDAVKHINADFYQHWLPMLREYTGKELFAAGEYWSPEVARLEQYLDRVDGNMSLFDVPLHFHLYQASIQGEQYDLRGLFPGTLAGENPCRAVTFVDNHDTQPGQALQSFVQAWFKPMAYALILLREAGYPCVFYGDYYGIPHDGIAAAEDLTLLLKARSEFAYGRQHDYIDDPRVIGWTREGDREHEGSGIAVLLSNGAGGSKRMYVGVGFKGKVFRDFLGKCEDKVMIQEDGTGVFFTADRSVSVWYASGEE